MHAHMDATSRGIRTKESIGIKIFCHLILCFGFSDSEVLYLQVLRIDSYGLISTLFYQIYTISFSLFWFIIISKQFFTPIIMEKGDAKKFCKC